MVSPTDTVDNPAGEKPLFRVGEAVYTWDDVVARARATGEWQTLEDEVLAGLAALRQVGAPDGDDVEDAARRFRYERGLLAGDELDAWLDARGLSEAAWKAYLRRVVARELAPDADVAAAEGSADVWAEGVCSGALEAVARELASLVAIAPDVPPERRDEEYEAFWRAAATEAAIAKEIESNRLEWVRVRYDAVVLADEDAAAEAALCIRADGDAPADVARRIGVDVDERDDWLDEVEPELASRFIAADAGALVGPVPTGEGFLLALIRAKTPPTGDDEDVRARAADAVASRAVTRTIDERVTWLEPL